jgi:NAD-dependent dihydropyrimidine dehydrogenase PreA subunit
MTLSEVTGAVGYFGNFRVAIRQAARFVDAAACIGCGECIAPCPVSLPNEFHCGRADRKAIDFGFAGALPNAPFLDPKACLRMTGADCRECQAACPVPEAIRFDDRGKVVQRQAGAIVVAAGAALYDCRKLPGLGYGNCRMCSPVSSSSACWHRMGRRTAKSGGSPETRLKTTSLTAPRCAAMRRSYSTKWLRKSFRAAESATCSRKSSHPQRGVPALPAGPPEPERTIPDSTTSPTGLGSSKNATGGRIRRGARSEASTWLGACQSPMDIQKP